MTDRNLTAPEAVARMLETLRKRTVKTLPTDWKKGRKCPDCGSDAERPKCMWDHGPSCVRHDPDAYEPPAWVKIPDPDCAASADMLEALAARVAELEAEESALKEDLTSYMDAANQYMRDAEAAEAQLAARDAENAKLREALKEARHHVYQASIDRAQPIEANEALTMIDAALQGETDEKA